MMIRSVLLMGLVTLSNVVIGQNFEGEIIYSDSF